MVELSKETLLEIIKNELSIEFSNKDEFLLSYLENKYKIHETPALYKAACLVLQRLWQGSICVSLDELKKEAYGFNPRFVNPVMCKIGEIGKTGKNRPLVFDGEYLYIQRYYVYQTIILNKIDSLIKNGNLHIITGGPGTGKTTSLSDILKNETGKRILLAAPTGKAAFRMTESLASKGINLQAQTIHRMLGTNYLSVNFKHNKENPLDADIIAIDECSMIDIPLMAKLLDAIPENNCHLYLLGDKNQLSPVGAGTVFADICGKFKDNNDVYTELTKVYRTESKGILELSGQILSGKLSNFNYENVKYCDQISFDDLFNGYSALLKADNMEKALESLKEFQVLCAVKSGRNGAQNINKELSERAKKQEAIFTPIIITENSYMQNLFNGDVGIKDREKAYFTGENNVREYPLSALSGYEDAFAITIHKSQGSEYKTAAVVYPDAEKEDNGKSIFTRELLYTAVTRAKKECLIYGSQEILLKSCEKQIYRASGIK